MGFQPVERWPTAYDADQLKQEVRKLKVSKSFTRRFYACNDGEPEYCQGDIIQFSSPVPVIDEEGELAGLTGFSDYWLLVGNTCDFQRDIDKCSHTQLVPIREYQIDDVANDFVAKLREYSQARVFYIPPWDGDESQVRVADLQHMVSAHKQGVTANSKVVARTTVQGWMLLHLCLVRYLARDDGRYSKD